MENIRSKQERESIAKSAIKLLSEGLKTSDRNKIDESFRLTSDSTFSWIDLDFMYLEWVDLCDHANDIAIQNFM
jgi:hypothetical protein